MSEDRDLVERRGTDGIAVSASLFATVGISHLTTSRQHVSTPVVIADPVASAGVHVLPPIHLMGLSSSLTSAVELSSVFVGPQDILHGPVPRVMSSGVGGGTGSLVTSTVALGAAEGTLEGLRAASSRRPQLQPVVESLELEAQRPGLDLHSAAEPADDCSTPLKAETPQTPSRSKSIRERANSLVIRAAQAWLAATKGAGYISGHPAERAVRESKFFLVWSCPQSVLDANLRAFAESTMSRISN